jgi:hypothetical protein
MHRDLPAPVALASAVPVRVAQSAGLLFSVRFDHDLRVPCGAAVVQVNGEFRAIEFRPVIRVVDETGIVQECDARSVQREAYVSIFTQPQWSTGRSTGFVTSWI